MKNEASKQRTKCKSVQQNFGSSSDRDTFNLKKEKLRATPAVGCYYPKFDLVENRVTGKGYGEAYRWQKQSEE